ncbi:MULTISPECIES: hypothetical protein [unclassified Pseudomonas]|uniref:hypothetical protein n=1 Tax=unclassified Pseudomonas TaxID=196821 RepID=UPI001B328196|nr:MULTISPECIES: hypothetical protein [unclassified Pseudomonas]
MDDIEEAVWEQAQACYDLDTFYVLLDGAVDSYKRPPGLDTSTRLHATSIGVEATQMLMTILSSKGHRPGIEAAGYVSLRYGLRVHLQNTLQRRLVEDGYASEAIKEDLLVNDLGL